MTVAPSRRGLFGVGDLVQLTDPKGRLYTITLQEGGEFHSHKGGIAHDDLIGQPQGIIVVSVAGTPYLALKPQLVDFTLGMPRGATIIYPKDAARIVQLADLENGSRVVEAGAGSGAMSCALIRAIGPDGHLRSFERRQDFLEVATRNVAKWFGEVPPTYSLNLGDLSEVVWGEDESTFDAMVLDMLAPWDCLDVAAAALRPGGALVVYVATTTQLSRTTEALRKAGNWTEPRAEELMLRTWHLEGLAVRPDHRMNGHTGFLLSTRRLAPGTVLPPRRTRPSKGAYGEDYEALQAVQP